MLIDPSVRTWTVLFWRRSPSQLRLTRGSITLTGFSFSTRRLDHASLLNAARLLAIGIRYFRSDAAGYALTRIGALRGQCLLSTLARPGTRLTARHGDRSRCPVSGRGL